MRFHISFTIEFSIRDKTSKSSLLSRDSWSRIRKQVRKRDRGICQYCGISCYYNGTIDHIVPLSRGGTDDISNLAWCCTQCNSEKGIKLLSEWKPRKTMIVDIEELEISIPENGNLPGQILLTPSSRRIGFDRLSDYLIRAQIDNNWTRDYACDKLGVAQKEWADIRNFVSQWNEPTLPIWGTSSGEMVESFLAGLKEQIQKNERG